MTQTVHDTDTLPTAPLGTTGMPIIRVGFGAWAIGGGGWSFAWGNQDDADSIAAIHREVAAAELPWRAAHRTGVIAYSPMQSGLLTGAFSVARAARLGADDWRSRSPDFSGEGLQRNLALAVVLRPIANRHEATVAEVAVAWTLAWPGVTGASVGARSAAQADRWIAGAALDLTDVDPDEIASAIERTGAGTVPVRP